MVLGRRGGDRAPAEEFALARPHRGQTGEESAGAGAAARWAAGGAKTVGLIVGESAGGRQPLLEPLTYVERALAPNADLLRPDAPSTSQAVAALIERGASIIILTEPARFRRKPRRPCSPGRKPAAPCCASPAPAWPP
jgi:hypothetical protein